MQLVVAKTGVLIAALNEFGVVAMDLTACTAEASPSLPSFTSKQIALPLEVIFYITKFMKFEDLRSFIQSLWPNSQESDTVRRILWQLTTHNCTTWFLNGKQLNIEYNFDPSRVKEERVLVNVNSLLPVFGGGIIMPAMEDFTSLTKVIDFVRMHVHVNMCSNNEYASCPCHLRNVERHGNNEPFRDQLTDTCNHSHFHHYCSQHVVHWLTYVLDFFIPLGRAGESIDADSVKSYLHFLGYEVSFEGWDMAHLGDSLVVRVAKNGCSN